MKDQLIPKSKFHWLLGFTALFIALCAAFFSVYGIATLFAGASYAVMVMASALELGKLVGTTFLYRYWSKTLGYLKTYMVIAIVTLMVITSLGIFGYLSAAYQKSSIEYTVTQEKIKSLEAQKPYYTDQITSANKRMSDLAKIRAAQESRMNEALTNEFLSRNVLQLRQIQEQTTTLIASTDKDIKESNDKVQTTIDTIRKLDDQINQMKLGTAEKKDVQTFKFVADALDMSLDNVARWFIISIIFVFDPLAICLILAYNVAVYKKEDERVFEEPAKGEVEGEVEGEVIFKDPEVVKKKPVVEETPEIIDVEEILPKEVGVKEEIVEKPKVILTDAASPVDMKPVETPTTSSVITDNYELDKTIDPPEETPSKPYVDDRTPWFKSYFKQS